MGVTAGDTNRELTALPAEQEKKIKSGGKLTKTKRLKMLRRFSTLLIQQHHDAVAVGVAVEMSGDDVAVLPADGHQSLVVLLPDGGDVPGEGQVAHWHVADDVDLRWADRGSSNSSWVTTKRCKKPRAWRRGTVVPRYRTFSLFLADSSRVSCSHWNCSAGSVMLLVALSGL